MQEKFYITTAIPYTNGEPHIGHLLEFIQADVIARYQRLLGKDVFFLTGTDEHGIKIAETAHKEGKQPKEFVDFISGKFKENADALMISYSYFIRTTDTEKHWPNVAKVWRALVANGDIYKGHYTGKYCVGCEKYMTESDLENGLCPIHKKPPEELDEENYFFRLSKYQIELKRLIESGEFRIIPEFRKKEVLTFIECGLQDVSFSRPKEKLSWGIPVPDDDSQTIYVWADALTNYLSGVDYASAGMTFQRFWPPDIQLVGKDIWKFHALIWPAMLLSAHLPLPKSLFIHGFLTVAGEKISKSLGNGISPAGIMHKLGVGADAVRYFFLREITPFEDGDYSDEKFIARYNGELANGIGNLVSRVSKLGVLANRDIELSADELGERIVSAREKYKEHMDAYAFNEALGDIAALASAGDEYVNQKKPWTLNGKDDEESQKQFDAILSSLALLLANIGLLLEPFVPWSAERIFDVIQLVERDSAAWHGKKIRFQEAPALFPRK